MERDLIIEEKLKELQGRVEKVKEYKFSIPKPKTNLRLPIPGSSEVRVLRVISSIPELVGILNQLNNTLVSSDKAKQLVDSNSPNCLPPLDIESVTLVGSYPVTYWIEDVVGLIQSLRCTAEIERLEKGISELPKFYTTSKKDELEFGELMSGL